MRTWITAAASTVGSVAFQMSVDAGYLHNFKWAIPWAWALSVGLWAFLATSYPPVRERWFKGFHDFVGGWIHVVRIALCVLVFAVVGLVLWHTMEEKPVDVLTQAASVPTAQPAPTSSSTEASQQSESPKPPRKKLRPSPKPTGTGDTTVGGDVNQSSSGDCSPNNVGSGNTTNCPPAAPRPESSLIHQTGGTMIGTEVLDSTVAPPAGGSATLVKQDGGEMSHTKIENSHVSAAPSAPATNRPAVEMDHSSHGLILDSEFCGFSSAIHAGDGNDSNLIKGVTVNGPSCDWHAFLDVVRTHRSDMSDFLAKWEEAMLKSWAPLPQDKIDSNRKELETIRGQLIESVSDDDKFNTVLTRLWANVPSFDVNVPSAN